MAEQITAQPNQTILDMVNENCGSGQALMQFCQDNNLAPTDVPVPGTVYTVSDAALALGDSGVIGYVLQYAIEFGTGGSIPPDVLLNDDGVTPMKNDNGTFLYKD